MPLFFRVSLLSAHFTPIVTVFCPLDDTFQRREAARTAGMARHIAARTR